MAPTKRIGKLEEKVREMQQEFTRINPSISWHTCVNTSVLALHHEISKVEKEMDEMESEIKQLKSDMAVMKSVLDAILPIVWMLKMRFEYWTSWFYDMHNVIASVVDEVYSVLRKVDDTTKDGERVVKRWLNF